MAKAPETVIADGLLDFSAGINSLKPTTIASPQYPMGLKRNQLCWLNNGTVRGGGITSRTGWQYLATIHDGTALYQGGFMYRPRLGDPYIVTSIGGVIYRTRVDTDNSTQNITPIGVQNPPNEPQAYMVQGEEFLVIQAGDNLTLPLFWDGQTLRRSLGPSQNLGVTSLNFAVPAIGSVVLVTLTAPYLGPEGQTVLINGFLYQVATSALVQQFVTLKNMGDTAGKAVPPATVLYTLPQYVAHVQSATLIVGTGGYVDIVLTSPYTFAPHTGLFVNGVPAFLLTQTDSTHIRIFGVPPGAQLTQVVNSPVGAGIALPQPRTDVGNFVTGFSAPVVGGTVTTLLSNVYTGALNQPMVIGGSLYEVSAVGQPNPASNQIYLTNQNAPSPATVNAGAVMATVFELPAATAMDYFMGRIWYAQGRTYIAGDIVRGPSGTLPYDFRDSILKVTENPLAIGGDGFTIPAEAGNIRALRHTSEIDTTLGQGKLYVFSAKSIYRLDVPVSRTQWIAANDATQPMQVVVQLNYGSVNDRGIVSVNSDLLYQTFEPAIRSLTLAQRLYDIAAWGNVPISRNENRILRFNDRALLRFCSGINFDNRLWETALPIETQVGVAFQAVVPLNFDGISTLEEKDPPAWEGMYEGLDILQLLESDFGGRQRAFAIVHSRTDHSIQVWELTDSLRNDLQIANEEARITWLIEFPALTWDQVFLLKRLVSAELWVDRVYGTIDFLLEYRPDGEACWHYWNRWQICSARNSCEDVNNPICYPITPYGESYRQAMSMPLPQDGCATVEGRPLNIGYQFQAKLTITGWCRIRGFILYSQMVEKELYYGLVCPGFTPSPPRASALPSAPVQVPGSPQVQLPQPAPAPPPPVVNVGVPIDPILDQGVDPPICVHGFCDDILMSITVLSGGNARLDWNQPVDQSIITALQLMRSSDNGLTYDLIASASSFLPGGAIDLNDPGTYTDPTKPELTFIYLLNGFSVQGDRWSYNAVSITTPQNTLTSTVTATGVDLAWSAPNLT